MPLDILRFLELREDVLGKHFAELDAHLIEGVDTPDDALREDLVFVEHDERPERRRIEDGEEDAVARPVTLEYLRLDQCLRRARSKFLPPDKRE